MTTCTATSSAATNSENFCLSCASKYHISSLLSCESRLPDDRLHSSASGRYTQQQSLIYVYVLFHIKKPSPVYEVLGILKNPLNSKRSNCSANLKHILQRIACLCFHNVFLFCKCRNVPTNVSVSKKFLQVIPQIPYLTCSCAQQSRRWDLHAL